MTVTHAWRKYLAQSPLLGSTDAEVGLAQGMRRGASQGNWASEVECGSVPEDKVRTAALGLPAARESNAAWGRLLTQACATRGSSPFKHFPLKLRRACARNAYGRSHRVGTGSLPKRLRQPSVELEARAVRSMDEGPTSWPQALPGPVLACGLDCRECWNIARGPEGHQGAVQIAP
jgi:hypothetical protein